MRGNDLVAFGGLDTTTGDDWFSNGAKLLAQGIANRQTNKADLEQPVTLIFQKQVMQGGEKVWVENLPDQEST